MSFCRELYVRKPGYRDDENGARGEINSITFSPHLIIQSALELYRLNHQVADAASKAGFDKRNHVAPADLTWAVRWIAYPVGE